MIRFLVIVLLFVGACVSLDNNNKNQFVLYSPDIQDKSFDMRYIFNSFGCEGKNLQPTFIWQNIPQDAKSLALTVYDPDAPTGSGFWHWIVVNIPLDYNLNEPLGNNFIATRGINQIKNDYGTYAYGGPCPPKTDKKHRYIFTLYAISTPKIDVSHDTTNAVARFMIQQNKITQTSFTVYYGR